MLAPQVPEGAVPGQTLQATSPDGLTFAFKVPLAPLPLVKRLWTSYLCLSIRAHRCDELGLVSAPKLTGLHRKPTASARES